MWGGGGDGPCQGGLGALFHMLFKPADFHQGSCQICYSLEMKRRFSTKFFCMYFFTSLIYCLHMITWCATFFFVSEEM